ncbi:MAG: ligase-associated DNA damage response endonuclease PdeM [Rudaea sp.]
MADFIVVDIAGETVHLLADRALFWPRERALLIADLHLGKADTFRSAGIALPSGGTRYDLRRLSAMLETTSATRLIVLGDLLHSSAIERSWRDAWEPWQSSHADLNIDVVAGNHDRALHALDLDISIHDGEIELAPFALRHAPKPTRLAHIVCGHLHPVVRMPGIARRWPVFVMNEGLTILPAFSAFTGGFDISATNGRLAVCNGKNIALWG